MNLTEVPVLLISTLVKNCYKKRILSGSFSIPFLPLYISITKYINVLYRSLVLLSASVFSQCQSIHQSIFSPWIHFFLCANFFYEFQLHRVWNETNLSWFQNGVSYRTDYRRGLSRHLLQIFPSWRYNFTWHPCP